MHTLDTGPGAIQLTAGCVLASNTRIPCSPILCVGDFTPNAFLVGHRRPGQPIIKILHLPYCPFEKPILACMEMQPFILTTVKSSVFCDSCAWTPVCRNCAHVPFFCTYLCHNDIIIIITLLL